MNRCACLDPCPQSSPPLTAEFWPVTCLLLLRNSYRVCFCKIASLWEEHPLDLATRPSRHALTALLMLLRYATAHQTFCVSATLPTEPPIHFHVPKPGKHRQTSSPVSKTCATSTLLQERANSGGTLQSVQLQTRRKH